MRILRRVPQRKRAGAGIVIADRDARLDRVRHQAVVDDVELGDVLGRFECGIDRLGVAEMPLIDRVVGRDVVDLRRAGLLRRRRIGDRGQHRVIDFDFLRGVARLRQRLSEHHRDRIADMAGLAVGERRMRRHFHRRAVLGMDHPAADQIADLVVGEVGAGEHRDHARHRGRRFGVDGFYRGMRVRGANEISVGLARAGDVVGVVALTRDEALIFFPAHRGADPGSAHGIALRQLTPWKGNRSPAISSSALPYSAAFDVAPPPRIARAPAAIAFTIL